MGQDTQQPGTTATATAAGRRCFVTVGATASFQKLLSEILDPHFLDCLGAHDFGELVVQTGPDHDWARQRIEALGVAEHVAERKEHAGGPRWPVIEVVSYTTDMQSLMLPCRGEAAHQKQQQRRRRLPGAMISHGGSGSILDAVRCDVPLVVVANPDLMDNHQQELVDAVDEAGWAVKGVLGHLDEAIARIVEKTKDVNDLDLSPYQPPPFPTPADERCGLFGWAALYAGQAPSTAPAEIKTLTLD